nr:hypothetical protein CFP56_37138 [Quercus suber]
MGHGQDDGRRKSHMTAVAAGVVATSAPTSFWRRGDPFRAAARSDDWAVVAVERESDAGADVKKRQRVWSGGEVEEWIVVCGEVQGIHVDGGGGGNKSGLFFRGDRLGFLWAKSGVGDGLVGDPSRCRARNGAKKHDGESPKRVLDGRTGGAGNFLGEGQAAGRQEDVIWTDRAFLGGGRCSPVVFPSSHRR